MRDELETYQIQLVFPYLLLYVFTMKSLQITIDDTMVSFLDNVAEHQQKTRTALIREAIACWIRQKKVEQFESQWISSLKIEKNTYQEEDEAWMAAEVWGEP